MYYACQSVYARGSIHTTTAYYERDKENMAIGGKESLETGCVESLLVVYVCLCVCVCVSLQSPIVQ
jgi:hypothetical protein